MITSSMTATRSPVAKRSFDQATGAVCLCLLAYGKSAQWFLAGGAGIRNSVTDWIGT